MSGQSMEQPGKSIEASWSSAWWAQSDALRQQQGKWMEHLGLGPDLTPSRIAHAQHAARLLAYAQPDPRRPTVLIVPAPIKAHYIWDLTPEASVVRRCLEQGFQVYLIAWRRPGTEDESMGLAEYAERIILDCCDAVTAETGQSKLLLCGHSLGGTLAAIFASLHPQRLHGLIELEGPMEFSASAGRLESAVTRGPASTDITDVFGNVPGSFLNVASNWADPLTFSNEPFMDWMESLLFPHANRVYLQVRRWTLDETPLPRRLFEEVTDYLYRQNRFAQGTLKVGTRSADPRAISMPILAVVDPRSHIIPPASIEAYVERTGSTDVEILEYPGDVGVMLQHVGVLVGENAHELLWPMIGGWMRRHAPVQ
jgi:polyhydroxyalkanoate synthase subunit PhaC